MHRLERVIESGGENVEKKQRRPRPVGEPVLAPDGEPMVELVLVDPEIPEEEENAEDVWDPADHDPEWPWAIDLMPRTRMLYEFGAV